MIHSEVESSRIPYKDSRIKYTIEERRCTKCNVRMYVAGEIPAEIVCDFCQMEEERVEVLRLARFYEYLVDQGIAHQGFNPIALARSWWDR